MTKDEAVTQIAELVSYTNNGKLLKMRIPREPRQFVPVLIAEGRLAPAMFMTASDAVRVAPGM